MRFIFIGIFTVVCYQSLCAEDGLVDYPRDIFNTGARVSGTQPFPDYDPYRLGALNGKRHEIELQIFDTINEAALRRDPKMARQLQTYGKSLGYIPSLAAAHYRWALGDKKQLDWLLKEDKRYGYGGDSLTILIFAYMDEWDKTLRAWKAREKYLSQGEGGVTEMILYEAMNIRKQLYGEERFNAAWNKIK